MKKRKKIMIATISVIFIVIISIFGVRLISIVAPKISLKNIEFSIVTEKDEYQYGDIMVIDLVVKNTGDYTTTVYLKSYGDTKYDLKVFPVGREHETVYAPTRTPLSFWIKSDFRLKPNEEKTFHLEWNLFRYHSPTCTGPAFGDLVSPGSYEIEAVLNLNEEKYGDEVRSDSKMITIKNLTSRPRKINTQLIYTSSRGNEPRFKKSYVNESLIIEYTPSYGFSENEIENNSIIGKEYENGLIYCKLYFRSWYIYDGEGPFVKILLTIDSVQNDDIFEFALYDSMKSGGWGSFPIQVINIEDMK